MLKIKVLLMSLMVMCLFMAGCTANKPPPTAESIRAKAIDLQQDIKAFAVASAPAVNTAAQVADIAAIATGNAAVVPLINAANAAVQASDAVIAIQSKQAISPVPID